MVNNQNKSSVTNCNVKPQACLLGSFIYTNSMNRENLSKLSKEQLIYMLLKLHDSLSVRSKTVVSVKFYPKSLTELSANKLEQMIKPKSAKPKSLVQLAAEKIEQSIKQPTKLPEPSKVLPTLKTLAAQALVKDKVNYWENKDASINRLDKTTMRGEDALLLFQLPEQRNNSQ